MSSLLILTALAVVSAPLVSADICYDRYNRAYNCYNDGGLSNGARIGIGLGIAVGVLILLASCSFWRRRQLRNQFSKFRPPPLPVQNENSNYNQYTNNPPPPSNYGNQSGGYNNNNNSNFSGNPYGNNPSQPAQTYQPSMAGQYTGGAKQTPGNVPAGEHEHGYEWEQAREEERLANNQAPPGYDVGTGTNGTTHYAPPPGPPPK